MPKTVEKAEIVRTEGVVGGKPRIEGTRIQVKDVVESYREWGWSVERIASEYHLTVQQVLEALKYYYDHLEEFPAEMPEKETA